jgi:hypothetical protein
MQLIFVVEVFHSEAALAKKGRGSAKGKVLKSEGASHNDELIDAINICC